MNKQQLEDARRELAERFPNFATLLDYFKNRFVPVKGKGTVGVDRHMRCYFDPDLAWDHDEILGALEHELGHICRNHFNRAEQYAKVENDGRLSWQTWNVAGDFEINDDLVYPLPKGYGVRATDAGMSDGGIAEHYYSQLRQKAEDEKEDEPKPEPGDGEPSEGEPGGEQDGEPGEGDEGDDTEPGEGSEDGDGDGEGDEEGEGDGGTSTGSGSGPSDSTEPGQGEGSGDGESGDAPGTGDPGSGPQNAPQGPEEEEKYEGHDGDCGSCSGGPARDDELPVDDPQYPGVTEEQVERAVEEAKKATGKAMADPNGPGNLGGVGDDTGMADSIFGPCLPDVYDHTWEAALHREIAAYMKTGGRGYQRPSRRLYDRKVIHVGTTRVPPNIAFIVDTSGSIAERSALKAFAIISKFKGWNMRFRIAACDTKAMEVRPGDSGYSQGGTDMNAGLEYVKKNFGKVDLCIIITDAEDDGQWHEPASKPPFPVMVFSWFYDGPKWAKTVRMPPLDEQQVVEYPGTKPNGKTYNRYGRGY